MIDRPAPLTGVTVIDVTQVLAGPYSTYLLALLGAEVIKIEPPGGEWTRAAGGVSALSEQQLGLTFCVQNGDKRLLEVDLKDPAGRDAVLALVDRADVFVENFRPGVAERLGFGSAALFERNSRLVYCSMSAFGDEGPFGGRAAYDHVVQAMSGVMELTGPPGSDPVKVGAPFADYATGLNGAFAVLAALRERDRTGTGQLVDVCMLDTVLSLMASNLSYVATTGNDLPKLGNEAASGSPAAGCYEGSDGRWFQFVANTAEQFERLCTAIGRPEWSTDERWSTPQRRDTNGVELRDEIRSVIATAPAHEWEARFNAAGVPGGVVRRLSEVIETGHPDARGLLHDIAVGGDEIRVPGLPFRLNGRSPGPRAAPGPIGVDNASVLGNTAAAPRPTAE